MTTATSSPPPTTIVDCDVHPHFPQGLDTLSDYLSSSWVKRLGLGRRDAWRQGLANSGAFSIPTNSLYNSPEGSVRLDAVPADGTPPSSNPDDVRKRLIEPLGIDRAVLLPGNIFGLGAVPNADVASTIARATNDWLDQEWLQHDESYRAAIVITPQDPAAGAAEIRRMAEKRGVVQVLLTPDRRLMGDPHYYPIYEAAAECGLPISVHPSATESIYSNAAQIAGDPPWYYIQFHTTLTLPYQANAVSLVAHGVFERFPTLKVIFTEVGVAWLLEIMWRMDKNWKGLRDEVPWLTRLPSEYMIEHFRFTTQPFLEPAKRQHLHQFLEMIDGERILMFSTDYPHWDGDDPTWALGRLPASARDAVGSGNARALYGDRLL